MERSMDCIQQHVSYRTCLLSVVILLAASMFETATAQQVKWMSVGSLHTWYSSMGCEREVGRRGLVADQQDGLQWPAIYRYQDSQAARALWIGVDRFTYPDGTVGPYVVHVGPRVSGVGEFFPVAFEMVSKFRPPEVLVDGNVSEAKPVDNDRVDPRMKPDRMIINVVNTAAGITMTRRIMQFSQQYHDNYFIYEYVFKNTGNINADPVIERPNQTLTGAYFYFQYRYAINADVRFVIGSNPVGWGINTMIDSRGDGHNPPSTFFPGNRDNDIRAQYAWHGKYPPFTRYDNIGGPIWTPFYDKTDTVGRLGAAQFVGTATLHADKSATDKADDLAQPSTMSYEGSDEPNTSGNHHLNPVRNAREYQEWMKRGRVLPRHADRVGPLGDPSIGLDGRTTPGGQSIAAGYGPYALGPGDSVRIVIVEAMAGLSREACIEVGRAFKAGGGSVTTPITYRGVTKTKNDWVYTGRDSLFQTFRRAIANYQSGYNIPEPPPPPRSFTVNSGAGKISLRWEVYTPGDTRIKGFQVYRAIGRVDSTYHLLYEGPPGVLSFDDTTAAIDVAHYYYIVSLGDPAQNNNPALNPTGRLTSSRYYTQTYDPAYRRVAAPLTLDPAAIRIVPNPYNITADPTRLLFPDEHNKITFKNIPGVCTIKIYSELGELIKTIHHTDGTGTYDWYQTTSHDQIIVSGVYIVVIETPAGERAIKKFVVIR